jgi:hypothetical protein
MANLPLDANVQFMTVMATKMPYMRYGRIRALPESANEWIGLPVSGADGHAAVDGDSSPFAFHQKPGR